MRRRRLARRGLAGLALVLLAASCVHDGQHVAARPVAPLGVADALLTLATLPVDPTDLEPLSAEQAAAANASLPLSARPDGGAAPLITLGDSPLDQLRSLDCLAQTVYYEARSESDAGQRAVAQVVLNRVHHPAYPASVCGVVYQGPLKKGGGCQFTFTCDGSLGIRPAGPAWERARRIAAEALAGSVFAPVGHATNYHTVNVFPRWAPSLIKSAVIGNHIFYRIPGAGGDAAAFRQSYAGREPMPVATRILFARAAPRAGALYLGAQLASLVLPASGARADPASVVSAPADTLPKVRMTERGLPESRVRAAYASAGAWRAVAPAPGSSLE